MRKAANTKFELYLDGGSSASNEFFGTIGGALRRGVLALGLVCVMLPIEGGAETSALELQLTREAWAIDREAFERQLQSAQTQIRALNEKLSAQEKNLQSDMESKVDALDAQLTRVSKERNQMFLDNEKLRQELSQSKEALVAVEALGANRQRDAEQSGKQAMQIKALSARLTKLVEVSKVRLQEIATLRAENEKLRQESDALRLALAQTEADKDAVLAQLQDRLLKLQARVEQVNQLAGISSAPALDDERVSPVAPTVTATAQVAPSEAPATISTAPKAPISVPAKLSVAEPPSFVDWVLAKAVQNKLYVLLALGVLLLLLGAAFWFLRRKAVATEMPLPEVAELPSPEAHAETYFDPANRAPSNDEGQILDEAVDSLVSKIHATTGDTEFSVTAKVPETDTESIPFADAEVTEAVEDVLSQNEVSDDSGLNQVEDHHSESHESPDSDDVVLSADAGSEQDAPVDLDEVIVPLDETESVEVVETDPVRLIDEKSQNEPNSRAGVSFVLVDEPPTDDTEPAVEESAAADLSEEGLEVESSETADIDASVGAELIDTDIEADEIQDPATEQPVFRSQYTDTQISVVIPRVTEEKKSLLVMDEFPTFGAYSKRSDDAAHEQPEELTAVVADPQSEPEAQVYGSSAYDSYELSVSEAYLNPRKPALALGDAANFGGYGAGDKAKKKRASTRRSVKRAQSKRTSRRPEQGLGFGSRISPIFDLENRAPNEPTPTESFEPPKPQFAPNSLVATGGVEGDIKAPLVSIPLSLSKAPTYGVSATSEQNEDHVLAGSFEVADQALDEFSGGTDVEQQPEIAGPDGWEPATDATEFDSFDASESTDHGEPSDLLDQLMASRHLDEPQDNGQAIDFEVAAFDEDESDETPSIDARDDSIDHLLSMAGHDLSAKPAEDQASDSSPSDDFAATDPFSQVVDSFGEEGSPLEANSDSMSLGTDFGESSGLSELGDVGQPAAGPDVVSSGVSVDDFGPSLSFGESSEVSSAPDEPNGVEPMPENVVLHPTSPEYAAPEVASGSDGTETSAEGSKDPFDPFIRVLWLIETGDVKDARLELEGLLQNENPDVRRMAYDFKERLNKSEASRA